MSVSPLGDILVNYGLITAEDRSTITRECGRGSQSFAKSVLSLGIMGENDLPQLMKKEAGTKIIHRDEILSPSPEAAGYIDPNIMARLEVIPVAVENGKLIVAMLDPTDMDAVSQIEFFARMPVIAAVAKFSDLKVGLTKQLGKRFKPSEPELARFLHRFKTRQDTSSAVRETAHQKTTIKKSSPSNLASKRPPDREARIAQRFAESQENSFNAHKNLSLNDNVLGAVSKPSVENLSASALTGVIPEIEINHQSPLTADPQEDVKIDHEIGPEEVSNHRQPGHDEVSEILASANDEVFSEESLTKFTKGTGEDSETSLIMRDFAGKGLNESATESPKNLDFSADAGSHASLTATDKNQELEVTEKLKDVSNKDDLLQTAEINQNEFTAHASDERGESNILETSASMSGMDDRPSQQLSTGDETANFYQPSFSPQIAGAENTERAELLESEVSESASRRDLASLENLEIKIDLHAAQMPPISGHQEITSALSEEDRFTRMTADSWGSLREDIEIRGADHSFGTELIGGDLGDIKLQSESNELEEIMLSSEHAPRTAERKSFGRRLSFDPTGSDIDELGVSMNLKQDSATDSSTPNPANAKTIQSELNDRLSADDESLSMGKQVSKENDNEASVPGKRTTAALHNMQNTKLRMAPDKAMGAINHASATLLTADNYNEACKLICTAMQSAGSFEGYFVLFSGNPSGIAWSKGIMREINANEIQLAENVNHSEWTHDGQVHSVAIEYQNVKIAVLANWHPDTTSQTIQASLRLFKNLMTMSFAPSL